MRSLTLADIGDMTGGRLGVFDKPCPTCGPDRRSPHNRMRRVLRIWADEADFASYCCARCGLSGWAREDGRREIDPVRLDRLKAEAAARDAHYTERQRQKALALWRAGRPTTGSLVEVYLAARGIRLRPPPTIRFLPVLKAGWHPAMMAVFGLAEEFKPGVLTIPDAAVKGIHLTLLAADGKAKAGTEKDKIMLGRSIGSPIVLAPMNDQLGLAITEGIEDGFSIAEGTGLGVWVAGSASRMGGLADAVPDIADCVTVGADADPAGQAGAAKLVAGLRARGIHADAITLGPELSEAA